MRVLTISWEYPPDMAGGLGRHVAELVPALVEQGIDMHVVTPADEPTVRQLRGGSLRNPVASAANAPTPQHVSVVTEATGVTVHRVAAPQKNSSGDIHSRVMAVNDVLTAYLTEIYEREAWQLIHVHDWLTGKAGLAL